MKRLLMIVLGLLIAAPVQTRGIDRPKKSSTSLLQKADRLDEYAQLSADELRKRSDEINDLIAELQNDADVVMAARDWKQIQDKIDAYKSAADATMKAHQGSRR